MTYFTFIFIITYSLTVPISIGRTPVYGFWNIINKQINNKYTTSIIHIKTATCFGSTCVANHQVGYRTSNTTIKIHNICIFNTVFLFKVLYPAWNYKNTTYLYFIFIVLYFHSLLIQSRISSLKLQKYNILVFYIYCIIFSQFPYSRSYIQPEDGYIMYSRNK